MALDTHVRLREMFLEFADLPPDERAKRLETLASIEPAMAARLRTLLGLDDALAETTVQSVADRLSAYRQATIAADVMGLRIGAFVIRREISAGGMGRVFLAERDDRTVEQRVAVKLIRPELFDDATRRRFHFERQALASLEHRDIAGLIDAGELPDGTPYLVMEFVDGEPVTQYADRHALDLRARLALVREVCDAVAYAHRRLIVHSDLKPSNVMVDANGAVKLVDFGIARPLRVDLDERTVTANRFWSPYHAAPELWRGADVGVACDVYGIGMVLYELLAGCLPFDVEGKTPGEIEHAVLNIDAPPPSVRCNAGPQRARQLRGDLDAIVGRCLRKLPQERYWSIEALVQDIDAYLAGRPVAARRGRTWYVAKKFVARHRIAAGAAAAIAVTLVASGIALWNQYQRTELQRDRAQTVARFLVDTFAAADPARSAGATVTAKQLLDQASNRVKSDLGLQPALKAEILLTMADVKASAGLPRDAVELLGSTLQTMAQGGVHDDALMLRLLQSKASAELNANDNDAFSRTADRIAVLDITSRERLDLEQMRAWSVYTTGEFKKAAVRFAALAAEASAILPSDDRLSELIRFRQGSCEYAVGEGDAALKTWEKLLADQRRHLSDDHPDVITTMRNIVKAYNAMGRREEALALVRQVKSNVVRVYDENSVNYAAILNDEGVTLMQMTRLVEAYPVLEQSLAIYRKHLGDSHPRIAMAHQNLAGVTEAEPSLRRFADEHFRESIAIGERTWPEGHRNRFLFRTTYCLFLAKDGRYAEAIAQVEPALASAEKFVDIKDHEAWPIAQACRAVATYGDKRSPGNRAAMRTALEDLKRAKNSLEAESMVNDLTSWAEKIPGTREQARAAARR